MGEQSGDRPQRAATAPPKLTRGGLVSGGRYELLEPHGGMAGQSFWQARDKRLGRNVALIFVDPLPGEQPPGSATGILDRTVALTEVYSDGLARVLDVIRGRAGGIVVVEWIPGRSLTEAAADPDPDSAVGAVWGLSDAATRAEERGLTLGLDSPDRIRLTEDGRAVLAFPGVTSTADTRSEVRGLGAVLYTLLTGAWPLDLPDGSDLRDPVDGRPPAARKDDGDLVDPTVAAPGVPAESAVLAMRSLDGSSVSSAATVRSMLTDRTGGPVSAATVRSDRYYVSAGAPGTPWAQADQASFSGSPSAAPGPEDYASESGPEDDPDVQKRRWQIMAGVGAGAVVVIVLLTTWMLGAFGGDDDTPLPQQLDAIERAAQASRSAQATEPATEETEENAPEQDAADSSPRSPSTPVDVSAVTAWQPVSSAGVAENSASAPNVADGDPSTSWSSDTYRSQLGNTGSAYKPGIGLMLTLDGAQETREVVLRSPDDGVRFQVRAADSANPTSIDETTLLGQGTTRGGSATVSIDDPRESQYVLVWITRLGTSGPQSFSATVTEVELLR